MNIAATRFIDQNEKIARFLLQIGAVNFNIEEPYTWSSGWRSPVYCDNRLALSYPVVRNLIRDQLVARVVEFFPTADQVAGVATGGIAHAALVADQLNLPCAYVRPAAKSHGLGKQIEGRLEAGGRTVVIEDLVSTGESSMKAVQALRDADIQVAGLISVFSYGFEQSQKLFAENELPFVSLCNLEAMLRAAEETGAFGAREVEEINRWRQAPETWGAQAETR